MTYSRDFRLLAVRLYKQFGTYRRVSGLLNVSVSTVHRWTTKGVDGAEAPRRRPPRVVLQEIEQCILAHIERYPFSTIRDVAAGVLAEKKVRLGFKTLSNCMKRLGISRKKAYHKTPVPTDDHKEKAFKARMRDVSATHDVKIASIDECYFSEKVLPNFGYCLRGRRLQPCTRKGSWKKAVPVVVCTQRRHLQVQDRSRKHRYDIVLGIRHATASKNAVVVDDARQRIVSPLRMSSVEPRRSMCVHTAISARVQSRGILFLKNQESFQERLGTCMYGGNKG